MDLICEKGIGKTHAKWSPVCTAFYRLLPDIKFDEKITGDDAKELKSLCQMGVFDIEEIGNTGKLKLTFDRMLLISCGFSSFKFPFLVS